MDPKTKKRATYKINNHNKLLYNYAGTIGVKNGYTEAANRTFISAVTRGGKTYLLTEMYGLDSSLAPPGGDVRLGVPLRRQGAAGGRARRARHGHHAAHPGHPDGRPGRR